jgi:hypothetical protein
LNKSGNDRSGLLSSSPSCYWLSLKTSDKHWAATSIPSLSTPGAACTAITKSTRTHTHTHTHTHIHVTHMHTQELELSYIFFNHRQPSLHPLQD